MITLSADAEPQIAATTQRFGTILENVVLDPDSRALDLDDASLTEEYAWVVPHRFHRQRGAQRTRWASDEHYQRHSIFNVDTPTRCPGVRDAVLDPRRTWQDEAKYDAQARALARMFVENVESFERHVASAVKASGPTI